MALKPISLPGAAGIDYSAGDCRHFALGDAIDVPGLSNPTRNLAARDNLLANKLNEVVSVVNNQEQFVPLPLVRTIVSPSDEVVVINYRIPAGFEARVLNAAVSTTPASNNIELNVLYAASFGGTTGTSIVSCSANSEFSGDVRFYQVGEFIVTLKNKGASSLEVAASVMLTMRPLGAEGTLLVGSIIEGPQGQPGPPGPPGPAGPPGTGGAGSPGMVWQGPWAAGNGYQPNAVVSFPFYGTNISSFICRIAHTAAAGVNDPQVDTVTWNPVAIGDAVSIAGPAGPAGPSGINMVGSITYVSGTFTPSAVDYSGSLYLDGPWTYNGDVGAVYYPQFQEVFYGSTGGSAGTARGIAALNGQFFICFAGTVDITLPKKTYGALLDYDNTSISLIATCHGTAADVLVRKYGSYDFFVKTTNDSYVVPVDFTVTGVQQVPN